MVYFYLFVVFLLVNYHFQVQLLFSARPHLKMPCLSSFKWKYCFRYPMPRFLYLEKMPDNWIMFVKMIGTIKDDWEVRFHIIRRKKIIRMYKWLDLYERRSDLWRRPSLRSFRQTKSLTSSAAGEYLCCRFSFATGFTKQATLPLLLAVEFKSDGVEPPNIMEAERPMCLFPASMLAVFICCSWPYSLRISSWKSKHDGTRISHKNLKFEDEATLNYNWPLTSRGTSLWYCYLWPSIKYDWVMAYQTKNVEQYLCDTMSLTFEEKLL